MKNLEDKCVGEKIIMGSGRRVCDRMRNERERESELGEVSVLQPGMIMMMIVLYIYFMFAMKFTNKVFVFPQMCPDVDEIVSDPNSGNFIVMKPLKVQ